jgi:hypothetical protein
MFKPLLLCLFPASVFGEASSHVSLNRTNATDVTVQVNGCHGALMEINMSSLLSLFNFRVADVYSHVANLMNLVTS